MAAAEPDEEQYDDEGMAAWYAAAAAGDDDEDLVEAFDDPYTAFDDTEEAAAPELAPSKVELLAAKTIPRPAATTAATAAA
eukprot:CAMPEP_0206576488 /NCGR_PEP_ID=MMETSP0325_2-20121206/30771_1 /ASSEMBLY_ACC=CAM_ASM_000347 /TAXON_ID=2866 /ORGANISM="Crypthecodinium cohnii, Strain Seligo" /LENGTH=80 /DNA_ID=CAMNT_0054081693 /DNA_START=146 /DNA_END=384 /DNA_ORIENTATION=-